MITILNRVVVQQLVCFPLRIRWFLSIFGGKELNDALPFHNGNTPSFYSSLWPCALSLNPLTSH